MLRLQHRDRAVTHVAVVLWRSSGAKAATKFGEFLVHLRPARSGVRRHRLGIHSPELGVLLPIQLRLHRGEQLVEELAAGMP